MKEDKIIRSVHLFIIILLALSSSSCVSSSAVYGPSSDERLAMSVGDGPDEAGAANTAHLAEIQRNSCSDIASVIDSLQPPLSPLDIDDEVPVQEDDDPDAPSINLEEDYLANLTGIVQALRTRRSSISEILMNRPDLRFFSGTAADNNHYDISEVVRECDFLIEQAEIALDSYIRDILGMPIISDVQRVGRRVVTMPRERVDFSLLAASIQILAPFDADSLMSRLEAARTRYEQEKEEAQNPPAPHRRRR